MNVLFIGMRAISSDSYYADVEIINHEPNCVFTC